MSRFCTLCSSSSGNSSYIGYSGGGILIDAGMSAKQLILSLERIGVDPNTLKAVFVTHEHSDHISGLRVFTSRFRLPIFGTVGTITELEHSGNICEKVPAYIIPEEGVEVGGMLVRSFETSHDSAESCGFAVEMPDGRKVSIITDTGYVTDDAFQKARASDLVFLESNYDLKLLAASSYPPFLKDRVTSRTGHLSNEDCSKAACRFLDTGTSRFVLGHLSRENNTPQIARIITKCALTRIGGVEGRDFRLNIAPAKGEGEMIIF
ncbi:MAG: MBL fold metallo-hydrolase [Clostridiales bacterium]|nr:MBL fold metallo-hydrolase [Clostridiales bacterium]